MDDLRSATHPTDGRTTEAPAKFADAQHPATMRGRGAPADTRRRTLLVAAALAPLAGTAHADEARLSFATTMPMGPAAKASRDFLDPWLEQIGSTGKGVLAVQLRDGPNIATMANSYDRVMNDVVQIAWSLQPLLGGKFPLSEVAGLPFQTRSCEVASVAMWRLFKTGLLDSEYQEIVPLWFAVSAQNQMHFAKPLKSVLELDGLKVNVFNRTLVQVVEKFKGTPISVGPEQVYEALQRGSADATMTAWTGFKTYRLNEVTQYHVAAPFGSSVHMFFMAKKRFDALPADARKVLLDASGEKQSRLHGKVWDVGEVTDRKLFEGSGKHTIVDASAAQIESWKAQTQPIVDAWAAGRPNGQKILETYRKLLAEVDAERGTGK